MTAVVRDIRPGRTRPATATCFGGGGAFGVAFNLGVARALQDAGIAIERGPMLGTSAGSWAAAALATGLSLEDLTPTWENGPVKGPRRVIDSSAAVWGDQRDDRVFGVALALPFGRRRALSGSRYRIADVVAASSSLPGFAAAHVIGHTFYVDGGLVSQASADLAPRAELLVAVVPMAGSVLGVLGAMGDRFTRVELGRWRLRHRRPVLYVRPDRRFRRYLPGLGDVFSSARIDEVYAEAHALGTERVELFHARHGRATWVAA
jgi:hypothetical protein